MRHVESRSIDYIPASERHGSVRSLFTVWFAANMQITTVVTGALAVIVGLSLPWAILAVVIGNVLGATVMALHSAQGPKLGIPQMIQSRAQFGFYGAVLPLILVLLMYIGFFASSGVLGGQALSAWTGLPLVPSMIIVSLVCTVVAILGYRLIHTMERIISAIGRKPKQRTTLYGLAPEDRQIASFHAPELAPIVLTPVKKYERRPVSVEA